MAAAKRPEGLPDLLLDADRLNMLLDIICTDYITASYASRENGKKVVVKALQKLYLSVYAAAPLLSANVREPAFADRCRLFYDELIIEFERKRHQAFSEMTAGHLASNQVLSSASMPIADDAVVREVLKPKLAQFVDEVVKERDRQVRATPLSNNSSDSSGGSGRPPVVSSQPHPLTRSSSAPGPASSGSGLGGPINADGLPASTWQSGEIRMEGWLRKKGQHVNFWRDRYFMIRSTPNGMHYLCYFRKKGDKEPRGWYVLGPGTTVDEVRESPSKIETKPLFTFRIRHMTHGSSDEVEDASSTPSMTASSSNVLLSENSPASQLMIPQTARAMGGSFDIPMSPDSISASSSNNFEYDSQSLKKHSSRRFRSRAAAAAVAATAATAVVLTGGLAGVGIGMGMGMSAAAAASAGAAGTIIVQNRNRGPIALAAESLETAIWWRHSILECIAQAEEQWKRYLNWYMDKDHDLQQQNSDNSLLSSDEESAAPVTVAHPKSSAQLTLGKPPLSASVSVGSQRSQGRPRAGSFGSLPRSIAKTFRTSATFSQETSWRLYDFTSKLRVDVEKSQLHSSVVAKNGPPPALRTSIKVMASPKKVFDLLMKTDSSFYRLNHVLQEAQILDENKGDHSDVIYWKLAPTYLWPVHVEARDLCLLRYWRMEQDASYFICFQSTSHAKCPSATTSKAVRGSVLGGGFIISPRVHGDEHFEECWVTLTIQMNPKGWIDYPLARSWYYMHAYGVYFLEMITALTVLVPDADKTPRSFGVCTEDSESADGLQRKPSTSQLIVSEVQYPLLEPFRTDLTLKQMLPPKFWSEPNATSFLIRGPNYFPSRTKVRSGPQAFRLVGVELLKSHGHEKLRHIGLSSFEKQGLYSGVGKSDEAPLIFIINFLIPGPPNFSLVIYFTPEHPAELKKNSAFADLCHDFFRGPNDEYRTKRLKLIPRVVQGTWSIREGVGSTPAILGTKVNHSYHRGKQYLEVDYDIGSSTVASGIVKMLLGYARDLVIDLAFVIEAQSSLELPERVLGCVRLDGIDMRHAVAHVVPKQAASAAKADDRRTV
jgi:hypothetical protein